MTWERTLEAVRDGTITVSVTGSHINLALNKTGEVTVAGSAFIQLTARQSMELRQALDQAEGKLE